MTALRRLVLPVAAALGLIAANAAAANAGFMMANHCAPAALVASAPEETAS